MSGITCLVSRVKCHLSCVMFFVFFFEKMVKLVGGGSVIKGVYPVWLVNKLSGFLVCFVVIQVEGVGQRAERRGLDKC